MIPADQWLTEDRYLYSDDLPANLNAVRSKRREPSVWALIPLAIKRFRFHLHYYRAPRKLRKALA